MGYSCIVFDTAPTGHTLRLLQLPSALEKGLQKLMSLKSKFGGLISQVRPSLLSSISLWIQVVGHNFCLLLVFDYMKLETAIY